MRKSTYERDQEKGKKSGEKEQRPERLVAVFHCDVADIDSNEREDNPVGLDEVLERPEIEHGAA